MNIQINDRIEIKGVDKNNPNHEGRIIKIDDNGVYIANMNMPYMGTYSMHFVKFEDIEK